MSRFVLFSILISMVVFGCGKSKDEVSSSEVDKPEVVKEPAGEPVEAKLIGKWKMNVERTIEKLKTNPKVKPEDHEKLPAQVERMSGRLSMEITESEMKMAMGSREKVLAYSVTSTDPDAQTVTVSYEGAADVAVVFTVIDDTYLNYVSSDTDDMTYYIWEPVE